MFLTAVALSYLLCGRCTSCRGLPYDQDSCHRARTRHPLQTSLLHLPLQHMQPSAVILKMDARWHRHDENLHPNSPLRRAPLRPDLMLTLSRSFR
ncbi:uncharacterized protein EDB91DRAFT_1173383 [Suillus paluster]|uniref:uncharacterized protein n=1 Tax=Suillus paluster TaxID=48578 RepID=UPI001B863D22|nr:uncharacterized protein EDB91DRAFT_1173383 [Suillus paluster]KAG1723190.1 hypothetical protein EDB91DRAFT_1173383 [Suillus paluster]